MMGPKKIKKRVIAVGGLTKSPTSTPNKRAGRRGRPPSKSPSALPLPLQANHNRSVSPDLSRTSSSDQDAYQGHPISSTVQSLDTGGTPLDSTLPPAVDRPRKLAKRERKALIKSSRRTRAVIDESFVANMNELSEIFRSNCFVGPTELHPVPMADDPSRPLPRLSPVTHPRGSKKPCGGGGVCRGKLAKPMVASLAPLCLPFGGLPNRLKPPTTQLKFLTPRCVRRFLKSVNNIIEPSATVPRLFTRSDAPPTPIVVSNEVNGFCSHLDSSVISQGKRGRGRPPKSLAPIVDSMKSTSLTFDPAASTTDLLTAQSVVVPNKPAVTPLPSQTKSRCNSTGTPRELRDLLTWDTMKKASQDPACPLLLPAASHSTAASVSTVDPSSPLLLQIVPSAVGGDTPDQRTTRGRSCRRLSTGPTSSGSFTEAESIQNNHPSRPNFTPANALAAGMASELCPHSSLNSDAAVEGKELHTQPLSGKAKSRSSSSSSSCRKRRSVSPSLLPPSSPSSLIPAAAITTADVLNQETSQLPLASLTTTLLPPRKRYKVVGRGDAASAFSNPHGFHAEDDELVFGEEETDDINTAVSVSPSGVAVPPPPPLAASRRSRGRPSKKTHSPTGRPKREAAVVGFASMVACSINSTSMLAMVEDIQTSSSSNSTQLHVVASTVDTTAASSSLSKRGRKPKKSASSTLSLTTPKPRGRPPKNPRPSVEEPMPPVEQEDEKPTEMASDIFIELKPPSGVSPRSVVEPDASTQRGLEKGKRGRRPTSIASPPPAKRREVEENGESQLIYASRHLRLFLLRNHSRGNAKVRLLPTVSMGLTTTQQLLAAGPISALPSRTGFFEFSSLSSKILKDAQNEEIEDQAETIWVHKLYSRLLNTPDLCDPSTRLTAPLLSLPCPLRQPEFYRFVCVSGLLNNFESALECKESIQPRILGSVSPQIVTLNSAAAAATPPFYPSGADWPPLGLRDIIPLLGTAMATFNVLDLLLEFLFRTWEAYAGRRSWLGKQLQQIRSLYNQLRTEHVSKHQAKQFPLPSAKGSGPIIAGSGAARKKVDRQTLERGAEVIRCLCGFRVEGGHVMVQCEACVTRQHLPCVWWALCLDMNPRLSAPATHLGAYWPSNSSRSYSATRSARCRAALIGALAAGGHNTASLLTHGEKLIDSLPVYYCPNCLELDGLTKDYPRTLAASLEVHDVAAVFSKTAERHEYWSLGTNEEQFLTDEFAIIHRRDYEAATTAAVATKELEPPSRPGIVDASQAVVVRIYQLWKDAYGKSWVEGGAFLRPYDLPLNPLSSSLPADLWHSRELVYDETSRLILPLSTLRGRCCVLSPITYRLGRPADLPAVALPSVEEASTPNTTEHHPLVFLCERLMTRNENGELIIKDIAPAYLRIITKPYFFLRHPEVATLRAPITRTLTAHNLVKLDAETRFGEIVSCGVDANRLFGTSARRRWIDEPAVGLDPTPMHKSTKPPTRRFQVGCLDSIIPLLKSSAPVGAPSTEQTVFRHGSRKPLPSTKCTPSITPLASPATIKQPNLIESEFVAAAPKKRGRRRKALVDTIGNAEPLIVDVDVEVEEIEVCLEAYVSPKLAEIASVADCCESVTVTAMLQLITHTQLEDSMGVSPVLRGCCLHQQDSKEDFVIEYDNQLVQNHLEARIVEAFSYADSNDLVSTSPLPSALAVQCRIPAVLDEKEEDEEELLLSLPDVDCVNCSDLVSDVPAVTSLICRRFFPVVSEAPVDIVGVADCEDVSKIPKEEGEMEEQVYQPISSSSESNSDSSNDNAVSTAPVGMAIVKEDSTSRKRHYSSTSATACAASVTATAAAAVTGSSSRRRKGSSPKKRIFDDPERILDLSSKSSGVDE